MRTDLLEHPAIKAWNNLQPDRVEPVSIEILDRERTKAYSRKSPSCATLPSKAASVATR